jgi:hypothetical protein
MLDTARKAVGKTNGLSRDACEADENLRLALTRTSTGTKPNAVDSPGPTADFRGCGRPVMDDARRTGTGWEVGRRGDDRTRRVDGRA